MTEQSESILITGCSSGIGYNAAVKLKNMGYRVIASARKEDDVNRLIEEGFEAIQLDLAESVSIRMAVTKVLELTGGKLDALFNNGAFGQPGAVEDLKRDVLRKQFETNVFGTQELTNAIIPVMRKQGHGKIIYNSSILGFVAMPFRGAYNASKYALEGLADTLRLELYGTNIHIVLIEPGPILSDFRKNSLKLFQKNIDAEKSQYLDTYKKMQSRLNKDGPSVPFTLTADAVTNKVIKILRANKPEARYCVTVPTYAFAFLKRLLPTKTLDWLLRSAE